jgi:carbonic anhydrase
VSDADDLITGNESYSKGFDKGDLPRSPAKRLAVLTCMDARIDVHRILGLEEGDAHVIRNAGGLVTDAEIRSLAISQRVLGTREIVLIHHTDCGMLNVADEEFRRELEEETGTRPGWAVDALPDIDENLRRNLTRIEVSPFLPHKNVRGFVYDVRTGRLRAPL